MQVNAKNVEVINKTKLPGVTISDDLKWEENTAHIVKKANSMMPLLKKSFYFYRRQKLTNQY